MARLGLDVATLIKVGKDARAETILARLMDEGISTRWVVRDGRSPTGASVHIASHDRNAAIFTFRGANTLLEPQDLRGDAFAMDMIFVSGLSGRSADRLQSIVEQGKSNGALIVANPGVRQLSDRSGSLYQALASVDVLILNRNEANALVPALIKLCGEEGAASTPKQKNWPHTARPLAGGGFEMGLVPFFRAITSLGPRFVVMTDGGAGAFVAAQDRLYFSPVIESEVKGTAGAGDAFGATFAAYLLIGRDVELALRAAAINAASVTKFVDTQSGLLTREQLAEHLDEVRQSLSTSNWQIS
jgi:ribokinase